MGKVTLGRATQRWLLAAAIFGAAMLATVLHASTAHAARGFDTGIYEPDFNTNDSAAQTTAFNHAQQVHAGSVIIYVNWNSVAPSDPNPGFHPDHPNDPRYNFDSTDAAVLDAVARGLNPVIAFTNAPRWAEGPGRPAESVAPAGSWRPDPAAVGDFTRALAERYSGHFQHLPAVRFWQLWAEPNLAINLGPQFTGNTPVGFDVYRPMLDAFYSNLKAVSPQNVAVTGGTAPYGGLTPARGLTFQRMLPLTFWRGLLCEPLSAKKKKGKKKKNRAASAAAGCSPPRFDIAAHHAINVGAPTRHARNLNDASTPDIGRLKTILRKGGAGSKPIWNTEIWWNSNPPGRGVSLKTQARYLSQSFYLLWKQGVQAAFWFELKDLIPNGSDPIPTCGLFFKDYTPKPAVQAFQFPFAVERISPSRVRVWGMAPGAGRVLITSHGHRVRSLAASGNRVFTGTIRMRGRARLKAKQGSQSSLLAPEFKVSKKG